MATLSAPLPDGPIGWVMDAKTRRRVGVSLDTDAWDPYFRSLERTVQSTPERLKAVYVPSHAATIGTTSVPMPSLATGLYRVTYSLQQVLVASVSLTLQVTVGWTRHDGTSQAEVGTSLNTNTLTTKETKTFLFRVQEGTPITYAVAYADGGGATAGRFDFDIVVEAMPG